SPPVPRPRLARASAEGHYPSTPAAAPAASHAAPARPRLAVVKPVQEVLDNGTSHADPPAWSPTLPAPAGRTRSISGESGSISAPGNHRDHPGNPNSDSEFRR